MGTEPRRPQRGGGPVGEECLRDTIARGTVWPSTDPQFHPDTRPGAQREQETIWAGTGTLHPEQDPHPTPPPPPRRSPELPLRVLRTGPAQKMLQGEAVTCRPAPFLTSELRAS